MLSLFQKITPNPSFVLDGISRFDFGQGTFLGREISSFIISYCCAFVSPHTLINMFSLRKLLVSGIYWSSDFPASHSQASCPS